MSVRLISQNDINAVATYAFVHGLTTDARLFADVLVLHNIRSLQEAYPGRPWLTDTVTAALAYQYHPVEATPLEVAEHCEQIDYQMQLEDWDSSHANEVLVAVKGHANGDTAAYERGVADAKAGKPCAYGCHFGMRSTLDSNRQAYAMGHAHGVIAKGQQERKAFEAAWAAAERPDTYYEGADANDGRSFTVIRGTTGFWWAVREGSEHHGPFETAKDAWTDARRAL
jgi:hypothetical protein